MAYFRCGGGGIPATLKTDMNSVLNKKFGTISQDYPPNEWADDVNLLGKLPERTASGTIAHFDDGADLVPLKSCEVTVTPSQSGTGDPSPANPRPLNSFSSLTVEHTGKNLIPIPTETMTSRSVDLIPQSDGTIKLEGTATGGTAVFDIARSLDFYLPSGTYFVNETTSPYSITVHSETNGTATLVKSGGGSFTLSERKKIFVRIGVANGTSTDVFINLQLELGNTATTFEPYHTDPHTLALGSTVYGLTGDCVSGEFEETHEIVDLSNLTWTSTGSGTNARWYCSDLTSVIKKPQYASQILDMIMEKFKPINYGATLSNYPDCISVLSDGRLISYKYDENSPSGLCAYPLATPTELTIDPVEVESFKGVNNVWCTQDNSNVTVEYRADIELSLQ